MVECDKAEITSLEEVFPNIQVFLCDFQREQSWQFFYYYFNLKKLLITRQCETKFVTYKFITYKFKSCSAKFVPM